MKESPPMLVSHIFSLGICSDKLPDICRDHVKDKSKRSTSPCPYTLVCTWKGWGGSKEYVTHDLVGDSVKKKALGYRWITFMRFAKLIHRRKLAETWVGVGSPM